MTAFLVRLFLTTVTLGLVYGLLLALPDLPAVGVQFIATSWHDANAFNRIFPVTEAFAILAIQLVVTASGVAAAVLLRIWRRLSPIA